MSILRDILMGAGMVFFAIVAFVLIEIVQDFTRRGD